MIKYQKETADYLRQIANLIEAQDLRSINYVMDFESIQLKTPEVAKDGRNWTRRRPGSRMRIEIILDKNLPGFGDHDDDLATDWEF